MSAKHVRLKVACWNLGGQPLEKVNNACPEGDVLLVREIARREPGWQTDECEQCVWTSFQHRGQWRGTAVGISTDIFDSVIARRQSSRGCALIVRLKNLGRYVFASVHAHTGVTGDVYEAAMQEVGQMLDNKWRHLPCVVGIDVNEEAQWFEDGDSRFGARPYMGSANFQAATESLTTRGLEPVPPKSEQRNDPTHFPRDPLRQGRQIDMILARQVRIDHVEIEPERRKAIGSDHALLLADIYLGKKERSNQWGPDSRPRWLNKEVPETIIVDWDDVANLARLCTGPRTSERYRDDDEVKTTFALARATMDPGDWKAAHKARKAARNKWCVDRRARILKGDWKAYREHKRDKNRRPGWWGRLIEEKSTEEITNEVYEHLAAKLQGPQTEDWNAEIEMCLADLPDDGGWLDFTKEEVSETIGEMNANKSVGPDAIGVDLLKYIIVHDTLGDEFTDLVNYTVRTTQTPGEWDTSLLALLAKVETPMKAKDLRPISMSSNAQKCINKLVMKRVFPHVRRPSSASCCGRGRQTADLIGGMTRLRDTVREWKLPMLCAKLDVKGASDQIKRKAAKQLVVDRTRNQLLNTEVRWMIRQLGTNRLCGAVPGGLRVEVECTQGIKQGAPESAEMFGLLMADKIEDMVESKRWRAIPTTWGDVPLNLLFYQDDVFVWDEKVEQLETRIQLIAETLQGLGLELAEDKTQVIASPNYIGRRTLKVNGSEVMVQPRTTAIRVVGVNFNFFDSPSQQARDLLSKAKAAAAHHADLLSEDGPWEDKNQLMPNFGLWKHKLVCRGSALGSRRAFPWQIEFNVRRFVELSG